MTGTDLSPRRKVLRDLLLKNRPPTPAPKSFPGDQTWAKLAKMGTSLWLDTGDLDAAKKLWTGDMEALTTNNSLLNAEIQKGLYDEEIPAVALAFRQVEPEITAEDLVREVSLYLNARHGLKLVDAFGTKVSVELHTDLAHDLDETLETGKFLYSICPTHFIIKVPMTTSGILATRQLAGAGIPVNHTLGFSARQNLVVAAIARPAYLNVFMGRLGAWVNGNDLGDGKNVGEKATVASQLELVRLREQGWPTRQIGASIRDGGQLETLAGLDVYTMPPAAAQQYHDNPPTTLANCLEKELPVTFANHADPSALGILALWEVDAKFRSAVMAIADRVADDWTPEQLAGALAKAGGEQLFPTWTDQELTTLATDGKAPILTSWRDAIANGTKGLDTLFTQAGLLAFSKDQAALDDRVRGLLG